jgi:thiol-disulfide isomerase/thioredoxin
MMLSALCASALACGSNAAPVPRNQRPKAAATPTPEALPEGVEAVDTDRLRAAATQSGSRGLLVNVWASWCGSCRDEVPMLLKLQEALARDGLRLVFVSADEPPDFPKVVELARSWNIPLPAMAVRPGSLGSFKKGLSPNWQGGLPATVLLDAQGAVRHLWEGPILEEEVTPIVQSFLAGKPVDGVTRTAAPAR